MCLLPPASKKKPSSKTHTKISLEGARIILGPDGAQLAFSTNTTTTSTTTTSATSKLPRRLSIRQAFYDSEKALPLPGSISLAQIYGPYASAAAAQESTKSTAALAAPTAAVSAPFTGAELVAAVSAAELVACNLRGAANSHSSCGSHSSHSSRSSRSRDRDRDSLLLSIERKNAEDIAALKLDRDVERRFKDLARDRDVQALIAANPEGGGVSGRGGGGRGGGNGYNWGSAGGGADDGWWGGGRAQWGMERGDRLLRERESDRDGTRDSERRLIGGGGRGGDAQVSFSLFQDMSSRGGGGDGGGGRGGFVDGIRDSWERRRSSVVSTLDRGARRLAETMAMVEAEVESMRRRERDRERRRGWY